MSAPANNEDLTYQQAIKQIQTREPQEAVSAPANNEAPARQQAIKWMRWRRVLRQPGAPADRQRLARWMAYLGCAGALGYGGLKVIWALGGTVGLSNPERFRATEDGLPMAQRFFDYWGTPILAGLAVVILLGLVYPWGSAVIVRPLLRTLAWAGSLLGVVGVAGLILTIQYFAGDLSKDRLGWVDSGTFLFVYVCFLVLGLSFAGAAWLTRR